LKRVVVATVNGDLPLLCSLLENNQFFDWNEAIELGCEWAGNERECVRVVDKAGQTLCDLKDDVRDVRFFVFFCLSKSNLLALASLVLCQRRRESSFAILKFLLNDAKVDVNLSGGISALYVAARCGGVDVVEYLLSVDGSDVNVADENGYGALHNAALNGDADAMQLLLSVDGIDVSMANVHGATPLVLASAHGYTDVVSRLLADWRVDLNAPDAREDLMPLYTAARNGNVDVVKQLASRDDVLQWYQRWANGAFNDERERAQSKLNMLLDFRDRLNRARFQRGVVASVQRSHVVAASRSELGAMANEKHASTSHIGGVGQSRHGRASSMHIGHLGLAPGVYPWPGLARRRLLNSTVTKRGFIRRTPLALRQSDPSSGAS
jgi:Ankyrin repeats (3 copies)/Ankyrin repeat